MKIDVDCDAGQEGEETPRALRFGSRAVAVTEIVDRWLAPDHGYFKLKAADGAIYLVRHDVGSGSWELVLFDSGRTGLPLS